MIGSACDTEFRLSRRAPPEWRNLRQSHAPVLLNAIFPIFWQGKWQGKHPSVYGESIKIKVLVKVAVSGIVARLGRPSGNVTGFATFEATLGGCQSLSEISCKSCSSDAIPLLRSISLCTKLAQSRSRREDLCPM